MNNKYTIQGVMNDRWVIWYKDLKKKGNKIGIYKIIDLNNGKKTARFAVRYKPRENQTQEVSDSLIISNCIANFYKHSYTNPRVRSRGGRRSSFVSG